MIVDAVPGGSEQVRWAQHSLNQVLGLHLPVTGVMGPETRDAIRRFQQQKGLPVDGILGPPTERALIETTSKAGDQGAATPDQAGGAPDAQAEPRPAAAQNGAADAAPSAAPDAAPEGEFGSTSSSRLAPLFGVPMTVLSALTFRPISVESPGGGRIKDKTPPQPADLETVTGYGGKRVQLHRLAASAWRALVSAARADGIADPLLLPVSGYRSPQTQETLWQNALKKYGSPEAARKWVAPPGNSAHQTGRAIDLFIGGKNSSANVGHLRTLPAYTWLVAHAERFGFYPYTLEPWHWEYNPPAAGQLELAQAWNELPWSWEEYEDEGSEEMLGQLAEALDMEHTTEVNNEVNRTSSAYIQWLQRSLNRILGTRLMEDGISGTQTRSAVRSFQQRHGLTMDGLVGPQTEAAMIAAGAGAPPGSTAPAPPSWAPNRPAPGSTPPSSGPATGGVSIQFASTANPADLTPYSRRVLEDILRSAGLRSAMISSTSRDPYNQARVMFNNLEQYGVAHQKNLYGSAGDQVIDVYVRSKAANKTPDQIKADMERKIRELGPTNVSRHASDPKVLNVFDVAPSSITNKPAFERAVRADKRVSKFLVPPDDPGYHLEIPQ